MIFSFQEKETLPSGALRSWHIALILGIVVAAYGAAFGIGIWLASSPSIPISPCDGGVLCTALPTLNIEKAGTINITSDSSIISAGFWRFFRIRTAATHVDDKSGVAEPRSATVTATAVLDDTWSDHSALDSLCTAISPNIPSAIPMHCGRAGTIASTTVCGSDEFLIGVSGTGSHYPLPFKLTVSLTMTKDQEHDQCLSKQRRFWMWLFVALLIGGELLLIPIFVYSLYIYIKSKKNASMGVVEMDEGTPLIVKHDTPTTPQKQQ